MTDEEMMARIRTCHLWISGSRITVSDAASHVASRTKDDYSYDRAAQVLGRMVDSGEATKLPDGGFCRRANTREWLCHKWNRKHTNAELGIESSRFGVPV